MKDIQNREELVRLLELYKQAKITQPAIEAELSKAIIEMTGQDTVQLKVVETAEPDTNSTFGAVSLPESIGDRLLLTVLVDKDAILNLVSPEDVLDLISLEVKDSQKTLKSYSKMIKSKEENELSLSDALIFFLGLYRDSLKRMQESKQDLYDKLRGNRTIQSPEHIEAEIKALEENADIFAVSERLTVSKKMPKVFADHAMEIAKVSGNSLTDVSKVPLFYRDEEPVMNQFYQQRRALSDGTYDLSKGRSQKVEHNYIPKTNQ